MSELTVAAEGTIQNADSEPASSGELASSGPGLQHELHVDEQKVIHVKVSNLGGISAAALDLEVEEMEGMEGRQQLQISLCETGELLLKVDLPHRTDHELISARFDKHEQALHIAAPPIANC